MITDAKFIRESSEGKPRPLMIFFEDNLVHVVNENMHLSKLIVEVPSPFPYTDSKMVPWNYHYNYVNEPVVDNISSIGGMTRSGRCYAPTAIETLPLNPTKELSKSKEFETSLDLINDSIIENEAFEFLKFIKHNKYSVVEQLNKLPTRISLLALINSELHHKALMKVLSEAYVAHNILMEKMDKFVGNISTNNMIAFFDDEIPSSRRGNTKALYITINCKRYTLPRALLENGSSVNVIPMATLSRLLVDPSHVRKTHLVVRAFDGTKKEVIRNIKLSI